MDEILRCSSPLTAAEEGSRSENQAEPRLVVRKMPGSFREDKTSVLRRLHCIDLFLFASVAILGEGRITYDEVEFFMIGLFGGSICVFRHDLDAVCIPYKKCLPDYRIESDLAVRPRIRVKLQGCEVQTEGSDTDGRGADVNAMHLLVECIPNRFPGRLACACLEIDEPSQRLNEKDSGAAGDVQNGLRSGETLHHFLENE